MWLLSSGWCGAFQKIIMLQFEINLALCSHPNLKHSPDYFLNYTPIISSWISLDEATMNDSKLWRDFYKVLHYFFNSHGLCNWILNNLVRVLRWKTHFYVCIELCKLCGNYRFLTTELRRPFQLPLASFSKRGLVPIISYENNASFTCKLSSFS